MATYVGQFRGRKKIGRHLLVLWLQLSVCGYVGLFCVGRGREVGEVGRYGGREVGRLGAVVVPWSGLVREACSRHSPMSSAVLLGATRSDARWPRDIMCGCRPAHTPRNDRLSLASVRIVSSRVAHVVVLQNVHPRHTLRAHRQCVYALSRHESHMLSYYNKLYIQGIQRVHTYSASTHVVKLLGMPWLQPDPRMLQRRQGANILRLPPVRRFWRSWDEWPDKGTRVGRGDRTLLENTCSIDTRTAGVAGAAAAASAARAAIAP